MYNVVMSSCLWMKTTEPKSLHVPPCRSTCNMRRICRNRIPRMAEVANTCPLEPTYEQCKDMITNFEIRKYNRLIDDVVMEASIEKYP